MKKKDILDEQFFEEYGTDHEGFDGITGLLGGVVMGASILIAGYVIGSLLHFLLGLFFAWLRGAA
jgi:hypothetical protein